MNYSEVIYVSEKKALLELQCNHAQTSEHDRMTIRVYRMGKFVPSAALSAAKRKEEEHYTRYYPHHCPKCDIATFSITADHINQQIHFGPSGNLGMVTQEYQGRGIGRYCMAQLIKEVATKYPNYQISNGKLSYVDADTEEKKLNRNNFYRNLGFSLVLDEDETDGHFKCRSVSHLNIKWNRRKIRRVSIPVLNRFIAAASDLKHENIGYRRGYRAASQARDLMIQKLFNHQLINLALISLLVGGAYWYLKTR